MPRLVEITIPSKDTDQLVADIQKRVSGIVSIRVQKGISIKPQGDVIALEITAKNGPQLMRLLSRKGIGNNPSTSISSSQPLSVTSSSSNAKVVNDSNESSWEEMEQMLVRDSNATPNVLILMFAAGAIAAIGIATNSLHLVIGAMLIAPAFEPLVRIPLGFITKSRSWKRGIAVFAKVYAALFLGAIVATLIVHAASEKSFGATPSYLESFDLMSYWSKVTLLSVIVSVFAGIAGALHVSANRSILTTGVMAALALVPSATLMAVGLVHGDFELLGSSALRWILDVFVVIATGFGVFTWKHHKTHERFMLPARS